MHKGLPAFALLILLPLLVLAGTSTESSYPARALRFGTATTDVVDAGSNSSLDTVNTWTMMLLLFPTTLTDNRRLFGKTDPVSPFGEKRCSLVFAAGNFDVIIARATTDTSYITSSAPLANVNRWYWIIITYNSAAAPAVHIYTSGLLGALAEATYSTATNGTGAVADDNPASLVIGNRTAGGVVAFQGSIAIAAHFNVTLSFKEALDLRADPFSVRRGLVGLWMLGENGSGLVMDYSGQSNEGTITGAIPVEGLSLFARPGTRPGRLAAAGPLNRLLMGAGR